MSDWVTVKIPEGATHVRVRSVDREEQARWLHEQLTPYTRVRRFRPLAWLRGRQRATQPSYMGTRR